MYVTPVRRISSPSYQEEKKRIPYRETSNAGVERPGGEETQVVASSTYQSGSPQTQNPVNARGFRPPSAYSRRVTASRVVSPGSYECQYGIYRRFFDQWYVCLGQGGLSGLIPVRSSEESSLVANAIVAARGSINNGSVDIGVALGESRETIAHLAHQAVRLGQAIKLVNGRSFAKAAALIGHKLKRHKGVPISKYWLEYNYAWRPLISDIYGTMTEVQRGLDQKDQIFVSRGARSATFIRPFNTGEISEKYSAYVSVWYKVSDPQLAALARLGITNPANVVWELVPFSFVADWFIPVGTFLKGLTALHGISFMSGTRTVVREVSDELDMSQPNYGVARAWTPGRYSVEGISMTRSVLSSLPYAIPRLERSILTNRRAASAIALGRQRGWL